MSVCSREALPRNDTAFDFWSYSRFLVQTAVLLYLKQKAVGMWGHWVHQPCVGLADLHVLWCNGLTTWTMLSILWYFLFSPVLETPVLDVENLKLSAKQGYKGWLRQSVWNWLQELFLSWTSTVVWWMSWPVIFMLLLPGYILAKNGSLWQCRSFLLSMSSIFNVELKIPQLPGLHSTGITGCFQLT